MNLLCEFQVIDFRPRELLEAEGDPEVQKKVVGGGDEGSNGRAGGQSGKPVYITLLQTARLDR